tara:strand:- start:145 stop:426 length:282 start_codon:yes stop_codon:yes gene_type:complete
MQIGRKIHVVEDCVSHPFDLCAETQAHEMAGPFNKHVAFTEAFCSDTHETNPFGLMSVHDNDAVRLIKCQKQLMRLSAKTTTSRRKPQHVPAP